VPPPPTSQPSTAIIFNGGNPMKSMYDRKKSTCLSLPDNPKTWLKLITIGTIKVAQKILNYFAPTDDFKITSKTGKNGETLFFVFDRRSGRRQVFHSESELMIWIENRYR
jgi:hypothetical protein